MRRSIKQLLLQTAVTLAMVSFPVQGALADNQQQQQAPFKDMKSHWSADSVAWAVSKNIVSGYDDGTFKPNNAVTEAEFLSMLIRNFRPDIRKGTMSWSEPYYELASSLNYPVDPSDTEEHNSPISRLRVAELIASTQGVHYDGDDSIRYMYSKGLAKGTGDQPTIAGFNGSKTLTRAEAVQFIKNLSDFGAVELLLPRPAQSSDASVLPDIPLSNLTYKVSHNASNDAPVIKLDNRPLHFKTQPVKMNNIYYYPIQEICSAFGIIYMENSDGSVTTINMGETNTFRAGDQEGFTHYNPANSSFAEEEIPFDGLKPMEKINGVFMMPSESIDELWFAVNQASKKFANVMVVTNGQVDNSELIFQSYKQYVLSESEDLDGGNRSPGGEGEFEGNGRVYRRVWVREYKLPSIGTTVYATLRWNYKDSLVYKSKEFQFNGKILNGVATGTLSFKGDVTYYQENDREEQLGNKTIYDVKLPYSNGNIQMTWKDAVGIFSKRKITLP
ncbi:MULTISPECIES: S-layer homology domain-containing protein [unclassified Paenibacillus]|uniref:S-layer homology domain-containing protein n=1 Tax=unclassified Paenibacillus TaxID=185978 RepID=UPI002405651D|nr:MULTISPECIES: S-layer homology domain-containing protein [unclassified Paenibacillus]